MSSKDWDNREFVQNIQYNIMQIAQFLNKFDMSVRGKLADVNHRITHLERKVAFLEASAEDLGKRAQMVDESNALSSNNS